MSAPAVELRSVSRSRGGRLVLDGVDLAVAAGEFLALLGPSGCGKTTTLRLVAGFDAPDAGAVLIDGRDVRGVPPYRRDVNTVFQDYALFPHLDVFANVAFGLETAAVPRAEIRTRVDEALALVRLEGLERRRPSQLSGGQQQRVAVARALVRRPSVLLLDEPLGALDLQLRRRMQEELRALQRRLGTTFVYVTHDQEEALGMADRVGVMDAGRIVQIGAPRDLYARPVSRFVAEFIGETNLLEGVVRAVDGERVAVDVDGVGAVVAEGAAAAGVRVALAVRPEHVVLADDGLPGVVDDVVWNGAGVRYRVRLAAGAALAVRDARGALGVGAAVHVRLPATDVRVLAG